MFSIFEPTAIMNLPLNWISSIIILLSYPSYYWMAKSYHLMIFKKLILTLNQEFSAIFGKLSFPGVTFLSIILFVYIMLNNFLGLFPYIFTASSHGSFTLTLALPLWLGHMIFAFFFSTQSALAHFVPLSTPIALMPLMVIIEFISSMIRPFTLAIRLAANMIAGHLLLSLLSEKMVDSNLLLLSLVLIPLMFLSILEIAVSIIQSYVFSLLSTLYLNEVNNKTFFY